VDESANGNGRGRADAGKEVGSGLLLLLCLCLSVPHLVVVLWRHLLVDIVVKVGFGWAFMVISGESRTRIPLLK
jgi:hypothetical protein